MRYLIGAAVFAHRIVFCVWNWVYLWSSLYPRHIGLLFYDALRHIKTRSINPYVHLQTRYGRSLFSSGNVYGETPWRVLDTICNAFHLGSHMSICDAGSGLGNVCFWFKYVLRCRDVKGIELEKEFISRAQLLCNAAFCGNITFENRDFCQASFHDVDCVFFYGSSYSRRTIRCFINHLAHSLREGSIVISISYPLTIMSDCDAFDVENQCAVRFPWGSTVAYKNIKRRPRSKVIGIDGE